MFMVDVNYPSAEEEVQIVRATTSGAQQALQKILTPEQIRALQDLVLRVPAAEHVIRHAVELVRRTRPAEAPDQHVRDHVAWGAGPRASQALILGAKARAAISGRPAATVEDVRALAEPVLRHRVLTNFHAEAEGVDSRAVIAQLLRDVRA
jgi:MoxR-like ATPase